MSISKVGTYAFYNHPNLERAVVSAPVIEANAFQNANKLEVVDLTSTAADTINTNAFSGCSNLTHLIVRSTARSALSATSALAGTKIKRGDGGIYVPADLLDSYKGATNWSAFANNIYPLGEYPRTNFDSIQDSWSTILSNPSYTTDYAINDNKTIELTNGTTVRMDIAAMDADDKSDDSGKAKITWICTAASGLQHAMGPSSRINGGWLNSTARSWLIDTVLPIIPNEIREHIVPVKKTYYVNSPEKVVNICDDTIWIPSVREIIGTTNVETYGVIYDPYSFANKSAAWLTRSASNVTNAKWWGVDINGSLTACNANDVRDVIFGFCTD